MKKKVAGKMKPAKKAKAKKHEKLMGALKSAAYTLNAIEMDVHAILTDQHRNFEALLKLDLGWGKKKIKKFLSDNAC
jgi:hypothetical protein